MKCIHLVSFFVLLFALFNCSNDSPTNSIPESNSDLESVAVVFIHCAPERINYYEPGVPTYVPRMISSLTGTIFSDPISEVYTVSVLDTIREQDWFSQGVKEDGSVSFAQYVGSYDPPDTVNCHIETSVGSYSGIENIPNKLSSFRIVNGSRIVMGEPLKITWNSENTDFFIAYVYLRYNITSGGLSYNIKDSILFKESIELAPALFNTTFESTSTEFQLTLNQYNGPAPVAGSQYNMENEGKGFLYCELAWTSFSFEIMNDGRIVNIDSSIVTMSESRQQDAYNKIIQQLMGR